MANDEAAVQSHDDRPGTSRALLYRAAREYYQNDATQAQVAASLGVSRATVSRLLAEAKRRGVVRIEIVSPAGRTDSDLADRLAEALHLAAVHLSAPVPAADARTDPNAALGPVLAPAVGRALVGAGLIVGDVLLVSSGRTVYEVAQHALPALPGAHVVPTIGGIDQPEGWYQTNEITRLIASRIMGRPTYLFAPALPGRQLHASLVDDPAIKGVLEVWPTARCALIGVGAPPLSRSGIPEFVPKSSPGLDRAIGDVCSRFFDRDGAPVRFDGDDRLMAVELEQLRRVPVSIAVASGADKAASIVAGARGRYFNQLVTDPDTASAVLALLDTEETVP